MRILLVTLLALCMSQLAYAESPTNTGSSKRIVKWVDSKGVTHYGDKLPAQEASRNNSEMNKQGVVVKQNVTNVPKNEQMDTEKVAQQRKDSILLASYTKPEEIDAARDRYLQMDQAAIQALTSQKENAKNRLDRNNKAANGFVARKKPVPAYLNDEIKLAKNDLARFDKQIAEHKKSMDATTKRFADEKARFVALKQPQAAPQTQAATATVTQQ